MYELILTVMVTFSAPVIELNGHGVSMLTSQYEVAVQGFKTEQACQGFAGYSDLEASLTSTFGATTKVVPVWRPSCRPQPAATTTASN